jgi:hypothetical protein
MKTHVVRQGIARRKTPATTWNELFSMPYKITSDDGTTVELGTEPWPEKVMCPDCKESEVTWAEAGNTPGHRICPTCGSHWSIGSHDGSWFIGRARFYKN